MVCNLGIGHTDNFIQGGGEGFHSGRPVLHHVPYGTWEMYWDAQNDSAVTGPPWRDRDRDRPSLRHQIRAGAPQRTFGRVHGEANSCELRAQVLEGGADFTRLAYE